MSATEVYEVSRWSEVFETSESRKLKTLAWISERTDFDSTGWQMGLDEFGPVEWPRVYGNWMILIRVAAKAKVRGRLSGDKGEPWTASRIVRPSGCDAAGVQQAFDFAVKIGWLKPIEYVPGDSPGVLPEHREKNTATGHGTTRQNKTGRDGNEQDTAVPSRPEISKSQNAGAAAVKNNPDAVPLVERARQLPLLAWLGQQVVQPGTPETFRGRKVFSVIDDTIKGSTLQPAYWLKWYVDQLASNGKLRGANMAEAAFILAAAISVREILKAGTNKPALWVRMVADKNTQFISDAQFAAAAIHCEKFFGIKIPPDLIPTAVTKPDKKYTVATPPKKMTPEELSRMKARTAEAKKRILKSAAGQ